MNYYVLLGLTRDASRESIRQAYRTLARQYHRTWELVHPQTSFVRLSTPTRHSAIPSRRKAYDDSLGVRLRRMNSGDRFGTGAAPEPLIPATPRRTAIVTSSDSTKSWELHHSAIDADPTLGRKGTADLLRQLRGAVKDLRSLESLLADLQRRDRAAGVAVEVMQHRRES
jgi:DnaJ-like protein